MAQPRPAAGERDEARLHQDAGEARAGTPEAPAAGPDAARERVARIFTRVEDVVYVGLGALLAGSALFMLGTGVVAFVHDVATGALADNVVSLLDRILLVLMIVEILYTVQVSFREHVLVPEPFLIVGLIAGIRRVLVLTAEFSRLLEQGELAFRNAMIELALLTFMIVALVASLMMLRGRATSAVAQRS
jgi:hypothetical protein